MAYYPTEAYTPTPGKKFMTPRRIVLLIIGLLLIAALCFVLYLAKPSVRYEKAVGLVESGKYDDAADILKDLDSAESAVLGRYIEMRVYILEGEPTDFTDAYERMGEYLDYLESRSDYLEPQFADVLPDIHALLNEYGEGSQIADFREAMDTAVGSYAYIEKLRNGEHFKISELRTKNETWRSELDYAVSLYDSYADGCCPLSGETIGGFLEDIRYTYSFLDARIAECSAQYDEDDTIYYTSVDSEWYIDPDDYYDGAVDEMVKSFSYVLAISMLCDMSRC